MTDSVGVLCRCVRDRKGREFFVVSGGRFASVSFKSRSRALQVVAQHKKYLAYMQKLDRDKLYKQK